MARWHDLIADTILDGIVHNAHRITLQGDSMRKQKRPPLLTGGEMAKSITHEDNQAPRTTAVKLPST